jgi:hypothetical protein
MRRPLAALALAGLSTGCYDFHLTGPEDAPLVVPPQLVDVTVEYRQPAGCVAAGVSCDAAVVFFASWMQPRREFALTRDANTFVWRGVAQGVPANYPPRDDGYWVTIYDPHLTGTPTTGFTGNNLTVGGEFLTRIDAAGTNGERARVYVDQNGQGHNPL